jgi:hypothetical protein
VGISVASEYQLATISKRRQVFDRPALMITILYIIIIYIFTYFVPFLLQSTISYSLLLLSPVLATILLENKWIQNLKNQRENTLLWYQVVKQNRASFIFAGYVISFLIIVIAYFLKTMYLRQEYYFFFDGNPDVTQYTIEFMFIFGMVISGSIVGLIIGASFFRVRTEQVETGRRYNLLSAPSQVALLVSYTFIGLYSSFYILWAGQHFTNSFFSSYDEGVNTISFRTIIFIFILVSSFYLFLVISIRFVPPMIKESRYRRPTRNQIFKFITLLLIFSLLISLLANAHFNYSIISRGDLLRIIELTFILGFPLTFFLLGNNLKVHGKTCPNCNLIKTGDICISCSVDEPSELPFRFRRGKTVAHPTCPSCGISWNTLSRKCSDEECGFTIILSCEFCSSTLNPLWSKCYNCGRERKTIPELAFQAPGSTTYSRSQAYLRLLGAILITLFIYQVGRLYSSILIIFANLQNSILVLAVINAAARLLIFIIALVGISGILVNSVNERKRGLGLVANRLSLFPGLIILFSSFLNFALLSFDNAFLNAYRISFSKILVFLLALLFLAGSLYGHYDSLIRFRPLTPFNPKLQVSLGDKDGGVQNE